MDDDRGRCRREAATDWNAGGDGVAILALAVVDDSLVAEEGDRTLAWPDGSVYRITRSAAETGGELLEMEWDLPAHGWAPQPHVHPRLTEEYEVIEGSLDVFVGGEWRELTAGEAASVPAGTIHTFRVGAAPVRVRNVHRPALDFEPYVNVHRSQPAPPRRPAWLPRTPLHRRPGT